MRIPAARHADRPWRIHDLARDFRVEDVWALPTPGGPDDFPLLVEAVAEGDPSQSGSRASRALWALRWKLGEVFGWDDPDSGLGARVPTLRGRLPGDLRGSADGVDFSALPFTPLYLTHEEFAAEIANRTVHGVMHLGWVEGDDGRHHGEMAVYVKPNGAFGRAYMAAIRPFRLLLIYPAAMRQIERRWSAAKRAPAPGDTAPLE
ncbi:MAG TPA: DUF2867 domain-containing protein [Thermoleophilaceae bacterium]|nr:DUF2867 domain-containing protein [Thermoleophilaceae bacterium]